MASLLRVAQAEVARYLRLTDRRVLVGMVVLGLVIGAAWPAIQDQGVQPGAGLFAVAVDEDADLYPVVASSSAFTVVGHPAEATFDTADLIIHGDLVRYDASSQKSTAAADELERAARLYMDRALAGEADQAAAFPVRVNLFFEQRSLAQAGATGSAPGDQPTDDGGNGSSNASQPAPPAPVDGNATGNATGGGSSTQMGLAPSDVTPPFPMKSLLYTFAYLIPLTFVGELYGGSVFAERVRSRGLLLLSTPLSGARVLLGKSLPYVAVTLGIAAVTSVLLSAGWTGFLASIPITLFALAASLLIGILAPSQRALTFMLVSTNVLLSTFLFLPAIFTEVPPVAFLSPVGVIAASIRGDPVGVGELLYATVPLSLVTLALALLAVALFREETLFAPGGAVSKLVDGVDLLTRRPIGFLVAGALLVPIALALELFVLVFAVTLGVTSAFLVFLLGSAFVEEALKALPSYAHASRTVPRAAAYAPWLVGPLVGAGFFLGEKGVAGLGVLGFGLLPGGSQALATFGVAASPLLVLAPLVLHTVTAGITARASQDGRAWAIAGWIGAGLIHAAYNAAVILVLAGRGLPW